MKGEGIIDHFGIGAIKEFQKAGFLIEKEVKYD